MPILTACPDFASSVYTCIFRVYNIKLSDILDYDRSTPSSLQTSLGYARVSAHLYAKELKISVDVRGVYSGGALKVLSRRCFINHAFPMVRSIRFYLHLPSATEHQAFIAITSPDTDSSISTFVERIKHMAPMLKNISILLSPDDNRPHSPAQQLNILAAQLSHLAVDIAYNIRHQSVILDQKLCRLRRLAYVIFDSNEGGEQIMHLARRSASTLQFLDILLTTNIDTTDLIHNNDGSYVQYLCLHALKLRGYHDSDVPRQPVFPGAVPFPSLWRLDIGSMNPFGDDTAFMGNAATL
ncbi:hypothetical protein GGH94_006311 [Coemansia aciculifera]|uniref:Uncharacterized protein n=1 Tax=Coemansia aciculifera TaxID=417176 RepID=A0A9W8M3G4_9FUNG|nr:hypothetical protein GGH94_006311 [Coemansia aciculifera]